MPERFMDHLLEAPRPHRAAMGLPMVTFIMPTFGRAAKDPDLLNECVYWVTATTYPNWELLIINDAKDQKLVTDVPGVRIINWPIRISNLGDKMNLGVLLSSGSVCMPAEDDDISLPWRARQAVEGLKEWDYYRPGMWHFCVGNGPLKPDSNGYGYTSSAYRRSSMLGNHPKAVKGHDAAAHAWAMANLKVNPNGITDPREISYIYRWGVSDCHLSGHGDRAEEAFRDLDPGPPGTYEVKSKMGRDWVAEHKAVTGAD